MTATSTGTDTLTLAARHRGGYGHFKRWRCLRRSYNYCDHASDYETMTINSSGGANTITTLTAADVTSLTITGSTALTITNAIASATGLATIDASTMTKAVKHQRL